MGTFLSRDRDVLIIDEDQQKMLSPLRRQSYTEHLESVEEKQRQAEEESRSRSYSSEYLGDVPDKSFIDTYKYIIALIVVTIIVLIVVLSMVFTKSSYRNNFPDTGINPERIWISF